MTTLGAAVVHLFSLRPCGLSSFLTSHSCLLLSISPACLLFLLDLAMPFSLGIDL
ncbi:hypothetical protein FKP32DRAFT_1586784 [Trametes sanguinea]|nr:hypothetical protein FKP32DRAFT_1586784 [Trametes sanguinea]